VIDDANEILTLNFTEYTCVLRSTFNDFEVVVFPVFTQEKYCVALFEKILSIGLSEVPQFLSYHCDRVHDPKKWLNQLEKLIKLNINKFSTPVLRHRHVKFITQIEIKRYELSHEKPYVHSDLKPSLLQEPQIFSFTEVKRHLKTLKSDDEKILYLQNQIFDYQQNPPTLIYNNRPAFDFQCELEIKRIKKNRPYKKKDLDDKKETSAPDIKLPFNGELKVLCDVFYKLMNTPLVDGRPKLPWSIAQATEHICKYYCDENGDPLSPHTVRTYLSPSKMESRPKKHKEMNIEDILKGEKKK
jgi:hypothetical protein